jgi:hypothetical protein
VPATPGPCDTEMLFRPALSDFIGTKLALELLDALSDEAVARIPGSSPSQESRDLTARAVAQELLHHRISASIANWTDLRAGLKRYSGRVPLGFHARNLSLGCGYTEPSID